MLTKKLINEQKKWYQENRSKFHIIEENCICYKIIEEVIEKPSDEQYDVIVKAAFKAYHHALENAEPEIPSLSEIARFLTQKVKKDPVLIKVIPHAQTAQIIDAVMQGNEMILWYGITQRNYIEMLLKYYDEYGIGKEGRCLDENMQIGRVEIVLEYAQECMLLTVEEAIDNVKLHQKRFGIQTKQELEGWLFNIYEFMFKNNIVMVTPISKALKAISYTVEAGDDNASI